MKTTEWIGMILLGVNAVQDLRKREILLWPTLTAGVLGIVWMLLYEKTGIMAAAASAAPGIALLLLAAGASGAVGAGDGLALIAAGIWDGFPQMLYLAAGGLFLAGAAAAVLLVCRSRIKTLPMIPFFLAAQILYLILR